MTYMLTNVSASVVFDAPSSAAALIGAWALAFDESGVVTHRPGAMTADDAPTVPPCTPTVTAARALVALVGDDAMNVEWIKRFVATRRAEMECMFLSFRQARETADGAVLVARAHALAAALGQGEGTVQ